MSSTTTHFHGTHIPRQPLRSYALLPLDDGKPPAMPSDDEEMADDSGALTSEELDAPRNLEPTTASKSASPAGREHQMGDKLVKPKANKEPKDTEKLPKKRQLEDEQPGSEKSKKTAVENESENEKDNEHETENENDNDKTNESALDLTKLKDAFRDMTKPTLAKIAKSAPRKAARRFPPPEPGYTVPDNLLTAPTIGGFPQIRGITDRILREHLHPNLLARWDKVEHTKILVAVAFYRPEPDATITVNRIRTVLQASFGDIPGLIIGAPQRDEGVYTTNRPIDPFLVANISKDQAAKILERVCWSTPDITFFPHPYRPFVTTFVMTLGNIPLDYSVDSEAFVADMVKERLTEAPEVTRFLERHQDIMPHSPASSVLEEILESVDVSALRINLSDQHRITVFNIYMMPPTCNSTTFEWWINVVRGLTYDSIYGLAKVRDNFSCACCYSLDHPTGLCEVVKIADGKITPPDNRSRDPDIYHNSNASTRGRGTHKRGRGRGRGTPNNGGAPRRYH
ncbi:hypothetical protein CPC08DRAFT_810820 [Agrocybe pediades]|nr:hypothetical protein CPC08DRAFT_810820 [Agrocybe pediades]